VRNRTGGDYFGKTSKATPLLTNYILSAIAGVTWYAQFFFYGMGTTMMGRYDFSSWTLHMASIMIFGTLWGIALHEWKGSSRSTLRLVALGLAVLVASTVIVGYGNYLGTLSDPSSKNRAAAIEPSDLRCEYLVNPLGIDAARPRLSWKATAVRTADRGLAQSAFQIQVADDADKLKAGIGNLWDSEKVESDQSIHVPYGGKPLESRQKCHWRVRTWDQDGVVSPWSQPAFWSMGLLNAADWTAQWIGLDEVVAPHLSLKSGQWIWYPGGNPAVGTAVGTNYFRRTVTLPIDRAVTKALCRVTADDAFVLFVNGQEVAAGKDWKQTPEIDLAKHLRPGRNTIAVAATNVFTTEVAPDKNPAGLLGVFRFEFDSGEPLVVATDTQWRTFDKEVAGWAGPEFDDSTWVSAQKVGDFGIAPWGDINKAAVDEHRRLRPTAEPGPDRVRQASPLRYIRCDEANSHRRQRHRRRAWQWPILRPTCGISGGDEHLWLPQTTLPNARRVRRRFI
jgi:hypothetical protein